MRVSITKYTSPEKMKTFFNYAIILWLIPVKWEVSFFAHSYPTTIMM